MLTDQERVDIVRYRIDNAQSTLAEVNVHIQNHFYNTAANRMYYACYYAASALLIANGITTKSHDGVKQMFGLHFIKTGVLPMPLSSIYSTLFKRRLSGDYDDMTISQKQHLHSQHPRVGHRTLSQGTGIHCLRQGESRPMAGRECCRIT